MRSVLFVLAFIVGVLLVAGSSGTFGGYDSTRDVSFWVVPPDLGYLGFYCRGDYSALVFLQANSETDFEIINITDSLPGEGEIDVVLSPDYSGLPAGLFVSVETDDGTPVSLNPGGAYTFTGHVSAGDVEPGEYTVPLEVHATWGNGGASLSVCPIKLVVTGPPTVPTIEKVLLSGNTSGIPLITIFTRINHGNQQEFTSCGNYSLNDGAVILEYGIVSNGIQVSTACWGNGP